MNNKLHIAKYERRRKIDFANVLADNKLWKLKIDNLKYCIVKCILRDERQTKISFKNAKYKGIGGTVNWKTRPNLLLCVFKFLKNARIAGHLVSQFCPLHSLLGTLKNTIWHHAVTLCTANTCLQIAYTIRLS